MTGRIPVPTGPFSVRQARAAGLSSDRLRGGDLVSPFRGVRAAAEPDSARAATLAYAPRLAGTHAFTGPSAAVLWGLPIPARSAGPGSVTIAVAKSRTRSVVRGVITRELKPELFDVVELDGTRVTTPALTWCTLARECSLRELVRIGDAMISTNDAYVGRRPGFVPVPVADLLAAVRRWKGCVGVGKLRLAVELLRPGVASPPESDLRMVLDDAGFPDFEVNADLWDDDGTFLARPDLLLRELRLIVEYEGDGHRTDQQQFRKDITRIARLESENYTVVRVTADDLYRAPDVLRTRMWKAFDLATLRSGLESA